MSVSVNIEVNKPAPNFDLKDLSGKRVHLSDYKGKKVLLGFFRHAGCPFCNLRVYNLQRRSEELKAKNLDMIFFFESEESVLKKHTFHQKVNPIPLIADPEKKWYTTYGIEQSKSKSAVSHVTSILQTTIQAKMKGLPVHMMKGKESINTMPAEFLIDEKGIIKHVHYAKGLNDRMKLDFIFRFADE